MFLELKIHKSLLLSLTGLHCTHTNESLDYCIQQNKWCVRFIHELESGNVPYDLIEDFTIRFWLKYTTKMVRPSLLAWAVTLSPSRLAVSLTYLQTGHPMGTQKSAQLVLEYLICNPKLVANAWRGKLYRFSSGTLFKRLCTPLTDHLSEEGNSQKMLKVRTIELFTYLRPRA